MQKDMLDRDKDRRRRNQRAVASPPVCHACRRARRPRSLSMHNRHTPTPKECSALAPFSAGTACGHVAGPNGQECDYPMMGFWPWIVVFASPARVAFWDPPLPVAFSPSFAWLGVLCLLSMIIRSAPTSRQGCVSTRRNGSEHDHD